MLKRLLCLIGLHSFTYEGRGLEFYRGCKWCPARWRDVFGYRSGVRCVWQKLPDVREVGPLGGEP